MQATECRNETHISIDEVLPQYRNISNNKNVIFSAPTARENYSCSNFSPRFRMDDRKKLIMLEPRRLAARRAAEFMAAQLGESVGQTVGYRIRVKQLSARTHALKWLRKEFLHGFFSTSQSYLILP